MPASNSMATPSGRRNQGGDISVKKSAIPKLTGMAINKAMADVASVPITGTSAPKSPETGSQFGLARNLSPKVLMDGMLPITSDISIARSSMRTINADKRVTLRNRMSSRLWRFICASRKNVGIVYLECAADLLRQWRRISVQLINCVCVCYLISIALPLLSFSCDFHASRTSF